MSKMKKILPARPRVVVPAEEMTFIVDGLENALYGAKLNIGDALHKQALTDTIRTARDKLAAMVRQAGIDPWKDEPLDG